MDESTLHRSLRVRPPADPIYRPRLDAMAIPRREGRAPVVRARYRGASLVVASVAVVGLVLGAVSSFGGSRGVAPAVSPSSSTSPSPRTGPAPAGSGAFVPGPSLTAARVGHTTTLIPDGRVIVIGGHVGQLQPISGSVEALDPAIGSFEPAGALAIARAGHTATLLTDGRILVVGGGPAKASAPVAAELWDPESRASVRSGSLAPRGGSKATLLPDGNVLVIGHADSVGSSVVEVDRWDHVSGSFGHVGSLGTERDGYTATVLLDGRILIVGGGGEPPIASAEIWDPVSESSAATGSLATGRSCHTATLLPDGRVLVVGGVGSTENLASAELWDPGTGQFTPTGSLASGRACHSATLLADGRVLVVSGLGARPGADDRSAELWDPVSGSFSPAGALTTGRYNQTATLLNDGRVLIIGGVRGREVLASTEIWDPQALPSPRSSGAESTPTPPPAAPPARQDSPNNQLRVHMLPALAELRTLSDTLSTATRGGGAADPELLREPSKALLQWALDEQEWSVGMVRTDTAVCPDLAAWKQAAIDLEVSAATEWRYIASGQAGDLAALHASVEAILSMGEGIERYPCPSPT